MKRKTNYKNLISLAFVLILLVSMTIAPAYADLIPQRIKAGIASAITALNITMNSTIAPVQEMIDYIGDPFDVNYTWAEMWNDRPQIQIWDDYIEIDGKQYTDIWISNEAAEKFRVNAFDFITAKNITSNNSGTFAEGVGTLGGIPLYQVSGTRAQTQFMSTPGGNNQYSYYDYGPFKIRSWLSIGQRYSQEVGTSYDNQSWTTVYTSNLTDPPFPESQYIVGVPGTSDANKVWFNSKYNNANHQTLFMNNGQYYLNWTPFDYDYVSQNIPPNQSLPSDTGMMIRVPSTDPQGNPYFDTFLHDNPEFNTGEPLTIDVTLDPDIMTKLDDLFDIIAPIIPVINNNFGDINFIENHEAPIPPIPDTPIVDATVPQVVNPIINEITNYGDQITEQIPQIIETIPNITEICENIDTAPYHDLDTGLDHLPSFFLPFITDLRSALSIWHYVTEWLAQISTTFAFITGCLVGTSIMTPIYAAIAGFMCIKIYRRMTG